MVGAATVLQARAADTFGELDHRQLENLPDLAIEAFIALLNDPYVIVHQHAVHALRRLWPPDDWKPKIKSALAGWINTYARDRSDDRFLVLCLDLYIDRYAEPDEFAGRSGSGILLVLEKIEPYVVAGEIVTFGHALRLHDGFIGLLARLIRDFHAWDIHHEDLARVISDLPMSCVSQQLQPLEALAHEPEMRSRNIDGLFIQLFTRASGWDAAERLSRAIVAAIPDDTWHRAAKLAAKQIHLATEFEAALARGAIDQIDRLSAEWKTIEDAIEEDWIENEKRRDPLRGLSR
jgi:hypothetical protein